MPDVFYHEGEKNYIITNIRGIGRSMISICYAAQSGFMFKAFLKIFHCARDRPGFHKINFTHKLLEKK